jgi:hypothetical protein
VQTRVFERATAAVRGLERLQLRDDHRGNDTAPYIDSGGLGQLVASYGSVMKKGGALKLLSVNSRNHDLLSITRLVTVFESFDSEAEAVQSFSDGESLKTPLMHTVVVSDAQLAH